MITSIGRAPRARLVRAEVACRGRVQRSRAEVACRGMGLRHGPANASSVEHEVPARFEGRRRGIPGATERVHRSELST